MDLVELQQLMEELQEISLNLEREWNLEERKELHVRAFEIFQTIAERGEDD